MNIAVLLLFKALKLTPLRIFSAAYSSLYKMVKKFIYILFKVGLVMGKGGETIKQICQQSGAHCQVDKNAPDTAKEKNILIKVSYWYINWL